MNGYKVKMTRKEIYNRYGKENVIIIPFSFSNVVRQFIPYGFTAGVYGWNCDIFFGNNYVYTYGYRPFGSKSGIVDAQSFFNQLRDDNVDMYPSYDGRKIL